MGVSRESFGQGTSVLSEFSLSDTAFCAAAARGYAGPRQVQVHDRHGLVHLLGLDGRPHDRLRVVVGEGDEVLRLLHQSPVASFGSDVEGQGVVLGHLDDLRHLGDRLTAVIRLLAPRLLCRILINSSVLLARSAPRIAAAFVPAAPDV